MANIIFSEGSGVADSVFGKSQAPIRLMLEKRGEAFEANSALPRLFAIEKSTKYAEKFTTMTAMDDFQPAGENGAYPLTGFQEGFSKVIEHMTWKNSFAISKEMMDDAQAINLRKRPESFLATYYRTRENLGAAFFGAAITGATTANVGGKAFNAAGADGQAILSKTHPAKMTKGTQSNMFSDAFSVDALAAVESEMQNFTGDNGELLDVAPDTIVIPNIYSLKKSVFEVIGADKDPATANNGFNYTFGRWNVVVWNYLNKYITANTQPWLLLDSEYNKRYIGAVILDREPLSVDSDIDKNTDANVWRGRARFGVGFNDWRFVAGGGISGGTQLIS